VVSEPGAKASRKPATRTCDESSWKLHGAIVVTLHLVRIAQTQENISEEAKEITWKAQHRLYERDRKLGAGRSLLQELLNCWDSSGRLEPEQRLLPSSKSQP
jgi:hypothetical protein